MRGVTVPAPPGTTLDLVPGPAPILGPETLGVVRDGTFIRGVEKPGLDGEVNRPAEKFGVLGPVKLGALGTE